MFDAEYPYDVENADKAQAAVLAAADERFATDARVVYFLQAGDGGPIKIGYCAKFAGVRSRVQAIQTGCPWPIFVRRVIRATHGVYTEKDLHKHFAHCRMRGEWFEAVPELAEAANATTSTTGLANLLAAAYERGRKRAVQDELTDFVTRTAKGLRESLDSWESGYVSSERAEELDRLDAEEIAGLLERRAA